MANADAGRPIPGSNPGKHGLCGPSSPLISSDDITLLPHELQFVSLPRDFDSTAVIKLALLTDGFLSYTRSDEEVSLLLDRDRLRDIPPDIATVNPDIYRAIQVQEGKEVINVPGVIYTVAKPVTELGVPLLYLSTYSSDLLLVQRDMASIAYDHLCDLVSQDGYELESTPSPSLASPMKTGESMPPRPTKLLISEVDSELVFLRIAKDKVPQLAHFILHCFLVKDRFFSFTRVGESDDEITLVLPQVDLRDLLDVSEAFPACGELNEATNWNALQITAGSLGFTESSLVAIVAEKCVKEQISILYISTYGCDFTLLEAADCQRAIDLLVAKGVALSDV